MTQSNQGWEFFESLFSERFADIMFKRKKKPKWRRSFEDNTRWTKTGSYCKRYVGSSDYDTASDWLKHEPAGLCADFWLWQMGFGQKFRRLIHKMLFRPCKVFFTAAGPFKDVGNFHEWRQTGKGRQTKRIMVRYVWLLRGVLMGNPLTKVILHLINMVARILGCNIEDSLFTSKCFLNGANYSGRVTELRN